MSSVSPFDATEISASRAPSEGGVPLLRVRDLSVAFSTDAGLLQAVDSVSFEIYPGETLALVGESGSGKSVTALSILGLIDPQSARVRAAQIEFEGRDLLTLSAAELRALRGNRIAMVFQDPMSSLNPVYTLGTQIAEPLIWHLGFSAERARAEAIALLDRVNIPEPARRVDEYPHQLSGGMRQRVMLAMALACRPSLLIADEPTTALDVTVQAQILELIAGLQAELGMSMLLITHDLGIVAANAQRAVVMYAGRVVEQADVLGLFDNPRHPYTAGLFDSLPRLDLAISGGASDELDRGRGLVPDPGGHALARLRPIEGTVPDPLALPSGCRFHPRCRYAFEPCVERSPPLLPPRDVAAESGRLAACWRTELRPGSSYLAAAELQPTEPLPPEALPTEPLSAESLPRPEPTREAAASPTPSSPAPSRGSRGRP
jgi:peptide/nickel transport system ATP-binding protein